MTISKRRTLFPILAAAICLLGMIALTPAQPALAQTPALRLGLVGDSTIDEYRGTDNRGGSFASVTFNWSEQLVLGGDVTVGTWGSRSEPRRTGFEFNWARSAATTQTLLSQGQANGLAVQVAQGKIDIAIIGIGNQDFAPYNANGYAPIYNGTLSDAQVTTKVNTMISNITSAVDRVRAFRSIPMIATTVSDFSLSPLVLANPSFSDPVKRQRVSNAIARVNAGIRAMALARGMLVFDTNAFGLSLAANAPNGILSIGGVSINLATSGDDPHNGILADHIHIGTIVEGLFANEYLKLINQLTGANIPLFSNQEILAVAGLAPTSNNPPIAHDDSLTTNQDIPAAITYSTLISNDTDPDSDPLSVSGYGPAAHGTTGTTTNGLLYTPNSGYSGPDSFLYQISDGRGGFSVGTVLISVQTVVPINHAPVANNNSYSTSEDTALNVASPGVLANDTDADGDPLTAVLVTIPTKGSLSFNSDGSFTYIPNANVNGSDSFTYRANDGSLNSNTATVTISITAVNDAPVAHADNFTTPRNQPLTFTLGSLLSNDTDVDGDTLQVTTSTLPTHGSMVPTGPTTVVYTPNANFVGTDSVVYTISDGHGGTSSATVTITVT